MARKYNNEAVNDMRACGGLEGKLHAFSNSTYA